MSARRTMIGSGHPSEGNELPAAKRRKVRKGTQSCWECKRRKIRCTFVDRTESVCDGCRSRQIKCVSQEFDYQKGGPDATDRHNHDKVFADSLARPTGSGIPARISTDASAVPCSKKSSNPKTLFESSNHGLRNALVAAWPSQHDFDLITSIPVGTSVLFHGTVCVPYSKILNKTMKSPRDMLKIPNPGSHPVVIARNLLMLGSFLQGIPAGAAKDLKALESDVSGIMSRVIETASRLVTSNDDLIDSLEGIECIMIESMYHNNAGNLRRAWLLNRRAMTIGQMMGLHLDESPLAKMPDIGTRDRVEPQHMWFRLVITDRYFSLMLGLPQGSPDSPFASPKAWQNCEPLDRMERIEAMVGGLILQRNKKDCHNMKTTEEIDRLLQDAAAAMPAQWWLIPDISTMAGSEKNALSETLRLMNQFTHFHLLAQLHLPYMLQPSSNRRYAYSKITAVNASREILSRFVRFRGAGKMPAYCRGVDFLAFIASTLLCLAHIQSCTEDQGVIDDNVSSFNFLKHQRPGDRGLLERTLEIMENVATMEDDAISRRIASILQRLLVIESGPREHTVEAILSPDTVMQEFP